jgi:hypothetical protein
METYIPRDIILLIASLIKVPRDFMYWLEANHPYLKGNGTLWSDDVEKMITERVQHLSRSRVRLPWRIFKGLSKVIYKFLSKKGEVQIPSKMCPNLLVEVKSIPEEFLYLARLRGWKEPEPLLINYHENLNGIKDGKFLIYDGTTSYLGKMMNGVMDSKVVVSITEGRYELILVDGKADVNNLLKEDSSEHLDAYMREGGAMAWFYDD